MRINWFPGHMEKARKELESKIKIIDFVIELVDARIPWSSKNPLIHEIVKNKPKILIMTKKDLCDEEKIKLWKEHFTSLGYKTLVINTLDFKNFKEIMRIGEELCQGKRAKEKAKGIRPQPLKTMVVGVPNVGKSTFINYFAKRKITSVANKPGHTRQQQWVKVNNNINLLDTPGILWPRFQDDIVGQNLAFTNSIKLDILPQQEIYLKAISFVAKKYPDVYSKYFSLNANEINFDKTIQNLKIKFNFKSNQSQENVIYKFLNDLANGKVGRFTFEIPSDIKKHS